MAAGTLNMLNELCHGFLLDVDNDDKDLLSVVNILPTWFDDQLADSSLTETCKSQVPDIPQKYSGVDDEMRMYAAATSHSPIPVSVQNFPDDEQQLNELTLCDEDLSSYFPTLSQHHPDELLVQPTTSISLPSVETLPVLSLIDATCLSPSQFLNDQSVPKSPDQSIAVLAPTETTSLPRYDFLTIDDALLPTCVTAADTTVNCQVQPQRHAASDCISSSTPFEVNATASGRRLKRGRPLQTSQVRGIYCLKMYSTC
jgi:hypothetical protein